MIRFCDTESVGEGMRYAQPAKTTDGVCQREKRGGAVNNKSEWEGVEG